MENSQSLFNVAENWYARLNRLKERHAKGNLSYNKEVQLIRLIGIMIQRMMKIAPIYTAMMQSRFKPGTSFQLGGIPFTQTDLVN